MESLAQFLPSEKSSSLFLHAHGRDAACVGSHSATGHHPPPPTTAPSTRGSHSSQGHLPIMVPLPPPTTGPTLPPTTSASYYSPHSAFYYSAPSSYYGPHSAFYYKLNSMKFEPPEVTRWITKCLLNHLPQWRDYPRDCTYRFATAKQEEDARIAWENVAGRCFSDYLTKKKELAKRAVGGVADPLQWKGHSPPTIRKDYWDAMCDQWATQEYQSRSAIATQNRAKIPDASLHTSGSITFGRHKKRMEEEACGPVAYTELFCRTHKCKESGEFVSERAKEVMESYEQQLIERHGDDSSQHPQFDASAWLVAAGQPKKG
ncbi:hypothetical protein Taro_009106 [Colocasia esculenta]|uniref:Uncharacterized protein n=1 Tax=Colocasia esculenta TaxID=4460 RepID=A0A843TVI1_COLES|nr:hypothetical protein [Colocasia esculenta]